MKLFSFYPFLKISKFEIIFLAQHHTEARHIDMEILSVRPSVSLVSQAER